MKTNNKEQKREKNNKGFSLVELIVVIAIMAVLVAVTAPQFTKYVDRSRQSVDAATVSGIVSAAQVGVADVLQYSDITSGTYVITVAESGTTVTKGTESGDTAPEDTAIEEMTKAIEDACGKLEDLKATANAWKDTGIIVRVVVDGNVTVDYEKTPEFKKYLEGEVDEEEQNNNQNQDENQNANED